jgi:hypothetical protein
VLWQLVPVLTLAATTTITLGMVPPILPLIGVESLSKVESGLVTSRTGAGVPLPGGSLAVYRAVWMRE